MAVLEIGEKAPYVKKVNCGGFNPDEFAGFLDAGDVHAVVICSHCVRLTAGEYPHCPGLENMRVLLGDPSFEPPKDEEQKS